MAQFFNQELSLAFDIYGCPQRCRHCWLGTFRHQCMDVDEVIDAFLSIRQEQEREAYYSVQVKYFAPDVREPHFGADYKEIYSKADHINGCKLEADNNFELLSLWRLARDPEYAKWSRARGIKRCQLKVFGLEETNDYFHGRKGAHRDLILATERLLEEGIIPRWQIYLNKRGVKELNGVLELVEELNLPSRVENLGESFNIHLMTFGSEGNGFDNHHLRPNLEDQQFIPKLLWDKTQEHFGKEWRLYTESELLSEILARNDNRTPAPKNHNLFFFVTSDWSVYPNLGEIAPWWKIGNLKQNSWKEILDNYKNNASLGLNILNNTTNKELALRFGDLSGSKLFMSEEELVSYYVAKACRALAKEKADC